MLAEPESATGPLGTDVADLAATVLEEEGRRQRSAADPDSEREEIADERLPGVGGAEMPLRAVVRAGGWSTIGVLFGLAAVDELDKAAFVVLAPDIQRALDLSDTGIGLVGALDGLVLFLAAIPLGALADRKRRTTIISLCTAAWAIGAALTGTVHAIGQLVGVRVLAGAGKANETPVQSSLLADSYPPEGRGRIFAIHRGASPFGRLIGPLLAGGVASLAGGAAGWRWSFVVLAFPAAALAVAVLFVPEPRRGRHEQLAVLGEELAESEREPRTSLSVSFARLKKVRTYSYVLASLGAYGFAVTTAPLYLSLILEEELGLDAAGRGVVGSVAALGALAGTVIVGRTVDRLFRRDPRLSMLLVAGAIATSAVAIPVQAYSPTPAVFAAVGFVGSAALFGGLVPLGPIVSAVTPYRIRSVGFGMVGLYLSLVGGVGGAILIGAVADALGRQLALALIAPPACVVASILLVVGSRFMRQDMAAAAADIIDERDERDRVAAGGEVPVLQVRNLDFSYGRVQVLFDVSIDVRDGEVLALLGTNGAGKSTLLRAISGLGQPDRGSVRLRGRTVTFADAGTRVRLGIVQMPGGRSVFPTLSVEENLLAGARTFVWDLNRVDARIERVLEMFPILRDRLDQPAGTLSGGEQQMLGLATALLLEPEVLLIDELSLGLAPVVVQQLIEVVGRLKAAGVTIVIVEQSVNVALSIADRAVFMEKGRVRFEGPALELLERDDLVRAVFLGGVGS